jgi:hypothetical protein
MSPYARDMLQFAVRCVIAFITGPMEFLIALVIFITVMAAIFAWPCRRPRIGLVRSVESRELQFRNGARGRFDFGTCGGGDDGDFVRHYRKPRLGNSADRNTIERA